MSSAHRRWVLAVLVVPLILLGCGDDPDSIVVVRVAAAPNLPPVVQIRGMFSNAGAGTERTFPITGGTVPLSFPTAFSVTVPRGRQGALDIALDGLDAQGTVVASGTTRVVLARGASVEVQLTLSHGASPCGNGRGDPGEACDDGNRVSGDGCSFVCEREPDAGTSIAADAGGADASISPRDASGDAASLAGDAAGTDLAPPDVPADQAAADAAVSVDAPVTTPDAAGCMPGTRQPCYTGPAGTMGNTPCRAGMATCTPQGVWSACDDEVKPRPETCNGVDDDCDGTPDDALGGEVSCGMGECKVTVASCANGRPPVCTPRAPMPEVCNGKDDDCDGTPDDGSQTCGVGFCRRTVPLCANGAPAACTPGTPAKETCNAIDDDCNGMVDDGAAQMWPSCSHQSGYSCMQFGPGDADCCIRSGTEADCLAGLYTWRNGVCCE